METTHFVYDVGPHALGRLTRAESPDGTVVDYEYDELSRLWAETWTVDGVNYLVGYEYDAVGRLARANYPTPPGGEAFQIDYVYAEHGGYLKAIRNVSTGEPYWEAVDYAADGQLLEERFGNG